jgi:acyl-CoA reductase-like NAD-dependent aldehyde dehydrogenase
VFCSTSSTETPLLRFHTENELIALANDTEFGVASHCYSRDVGRIWRVAEALEYGIEENLEVNYICLGGIDR